MDKIIYNISSYNRGDSLVRTIESIYNQADVINVALNGYNEIPFELYDSKINLFITDNEKGDAYKFYNLINSNGYYFTIDDDLIYPENYSQFMIDKIEKYNRESIITLHSRDFKSYPIKNYYTTDAKVIHFSDRNDEDVKVQFGGTGVMAFHTDLAKIGIEYFESPNMADVWIGLYAKQNSIDIINVSHDKKFIQEQNTTKSIYSTHKSDDRLQTIIANEAFMPNYNVSIIIPTYNNVEYIDECLGSIIQPLGNLNYEILVGIDSCEKTLNYILENRTKYPKNIKFYYFKENVGTYTVKNTLVLKAKFNNILFFDSDDIISQNLIPDGLLKLNTENFDVVTSRYTNFKNTFDYVNFTKSAKSTDIHNSVSHFMIKKELFLKMNGFEPWTCAADTEFFERLYNNGEKVFLNPEISYYRRIHSLGLTSRKDTGHGSKTRQEYAEIIKQKKLNRNFKPLPILKTAECEELTNDFNYEPKLLVHENQSIIKTNQQIVLDILTKKDGINKKQITKTDSDQQKRNEVDLVKLLLTNRRTVPPVNNVRRHTRVGRIK